MDFDRVTDKQAFKLGFAAYCADQNMTPEAATEFAEKIALEPITTAAILTGLGSAAYGGAKAVGGAIANNVLPAAKTLGLLGIGIPTAAGLAIGGGLGYGAAKLNEPDVTPDDIKAQELAATYKRYTDRLKARRAYHQYRASRQMM